MTSLRKQLLLYLVPTFLLAAVVASVCTYFMSGYMVSRFLDNQLRVLADSHVVATAAAELRPLTEQNIRHGDMIVQIWDREGRLLTSSHPSLALPRQAGDGFHDVSAGGQRWRVYSLHSQQRTVQAIQNLEFRHFVMSKQALQAGLPVALLIPISAVLLWGAIRIALRRLELVARAAAEQDVRTLGELPIEHVPTEIRPLVQAVNTLLARLRAAFAVQQRFIQDAAHELRTPITAMSLQLENLLSCPMDQQTAHEVKQLEAGLSRTKRMVEQLLRLARQEAPQKPDSAATVELSQFLRTLIGELLPLADHRKIDVGFASDETATVRANPDELRSLLHNLLDNALRYTPGGGVVDVKLRAGAGAAVVEIIDNGPGIPTSLLPRVFDRFFRIAGSQSEGSGLGLAIAKHAAERNHVELELANRNDRSGLIARVIFRGAVVEPQRATDHAGRHAAFAAARAEYS